MKWILLTQGHQVLHKLRERCHVKNGDDVKVGKNGTILSDFRLLWSKNTSNQVYIATLSKSLGDSSQENLILTSEKTYTS